MDQTLPLRPGPHRPCKPRSRRVGTTHARIVTRNDDLNLLRAHEASARRDGGHLVTFRLFDGGWGYEFERAPHADRTELRIVCPFITARALGRLVALDPERIRVITGFNLDEFAVGVSDIASLRTLLESDAEVRGIRHLHAKMYLFGKTQAVVTSANLTDGGLNRNSELGILTDDPVAIAACIDYFETLWKSARILRPEEASDWAATITAHLATGPRRRPLQSLGDFGAGIGLTPPPDETPPAPFDEGGQAFVKILGRSDDRVHTSWTAP